MELREYQEIGRAWITSKERCAIWAKPGMGKTALTLAAIADLVLAGDVQRVLVVAPKRVAEDVWRDEIRKWPAVHRVLGDAACMVGTPRQRLAALRRKGAIVYTINFENLPWLETTLRRTWPFDMVVVDEASKLRGFRTRQGTKRAAVLGRYGYTHTRRFVELTGTPAANNLAALWGQAWFLDAGERLGLTFEAFSERWFRSIDTGPGGSGSKLEPTPIALDQISERMSDLCLTLDPKDWFDMREPIETRIEVKIPAAARKVYDDVEKKMFAELESGSEIQAFSAGAKTMKTLQVASGTVYTDPERRTWEELHRAKLDALLDLIDEQPDPMLVGYLFRSDRARLLANIPGAVDLATPEGMAAFKAGNAQVGIAHPASVGHGIDGLQHVCSTVCFYSNDWDAELREQFIDRVGPMRQLQAGLDRPVMVYDIIAVDTIDELVVARHKTKQSIQSLLLDAAKQRRG